MKRYSFEITPSDLIHRPDGVRVDLKAWLDSFKGQPSACVSRWAPGGGATVEWDIYYDSSKWTGIDGNRKPAHLVLWNRIISYKPKWLHLALYERWMYDLVGGDE